MHWFSGLQLIPFFRSLQRTIAETALSPCREIPIFAPRFKDAWASESTAERVKSYGVDPGSLDENALADVENNYLQKVEGMMRIAGALYSLVLPR